MHPANGADIWDAGPAHTSHFECIRSVPGWWWQ
jgi:hypothetical protein